MEYATCIRFAIIRELLSALSPTKSIMQRDGSTLKYSTTGRFATLSFLPILRPKEGRKDVLQQDSKVKADRLFVL